MKSGPQATSQQYRAPMLTSTTPEMRIGQSVIEPITEEPYLDRDVSFDCKIEKDVLCYRLFIVGGVLSM